MGKALRTMYAHIKKCSRLGKEAGEYLEGGLEEKSLSGIWEQFSIAAAVRSEFHLLGNN